MNRQQLFYWQQVHYAWRIATEENPKVKRWLNNQLNNIEHAYYNRSHIELGSNSHSRIPHMDSKKIYTGAIAKTYADAL